MKSTLKAPTKAILLILTSVLAGMPAWATTLLSMSIDDVAQQAELIFEGEVLAHEARRDIGNRQIYTTITFAVTEVIKGDEPGPELQLHFSGGSIGNERVEIPGLTLPRVGEKGIYFVESVSRRLVNPLLGWSQGHYLINDSSGERLMQTSTGRPILEVHPAAPVPAAIRRPQRLIDGNSDTAGGIVTGQTALSQESPLSAEEFKSRIRALITP